MAAVTLGRHWAVGEGAQICIGGGGMCWTAVGKQAVVAMKHLAPWVGSVSLAVAAIATHWDVAENQAAASCAGLRQQRHWPQRQHQ